MKKGILAFALCLIATKAVAYTEADIHCLATAMLMEAGNQRHEGQRAVASVILNRANAWNKSVCAVVTQPAQFSWYKRERTMYSYHKGDKRYPDLFMKAVVYLAAHKQDMFASNVGKAMFFHTNNLQPSWTKRMIRVAVIQDHTFWKLK